MSSSRTKLVLLGTGNPNPDPSHQGCASLILADGAPYLVDFGAGVVRQAAAMTRGYGGAVEGLEIKNLSLAFLTHLHSDHTAGYPDLILTPWVMGRDRPQEVYGPPGIAKMSENVLAAYQADIHYRLDGIEPANDQGWRVKAHEIEQGLIYKDESVTVEAFRVEHGGMPNAFGFRFTTPGRVIVFSGDTAPCENMLQYGQGADILVHEVYSERGFLEKDDTWQRYHAAHHTSTGQLAEIASKTQPGLLVLNHVLFWGSSEGEILDEIARRYDGEVVLGADLQIFE
jgi:ribonuclease Z